MLLLLRVNLVGENVRIDLIHDKSIEVFWELQRDISSHIHTITKQMHGMVLFCLRNGG